MTSRRDAKAQIKREPLQPPKPRERPPRLGPGGTSRRRSPAASTCFVGIPSDRILFPSDRGDRTSFFQYMNEVPRSKARRAESGQPVGNHPRIQVDAARRASVLRRRRAAAKPGSKSSWPRVLPRVSTFGKSGWLQEEPKRRGFNSEAGWLLSGCLLAACWLLSGCLLASCWLAAPSPQSWSESLRDSPACYSQRGGRAKSGWKHFSKVLTQTCSDSVFDMSDIYVHDLRKTRTVNHTY